MEVEETFLTNTHSKKISPATTNLRKKTGIFDLAPLPHSWSWLLCQNGSCGPKKKMSGERSLEELEKSQIKNFLNMCAFVTFSIFSKYFYNAVFQILVFIGWSRGWGTTQRGR